MTPQEKILDIIATNKADGIVTRIKHIPELWCEVVDFPVTFEPKNHSERIYAFAHSISNPVCACGNRLTFVTITDGYREFCSSKCQFALKAATERRVAVLKASGGVGLSNPKYREKAKKTLQEKHGENVTNPGQIKSHRENMKANNPMFLQENVDKIVATIQKKYGAAKRNASHILIPDNICKILTDKQKFADCIKGKTAFQISQETGLNTTTILRHAKDHQLLDIMIYNPRSVMEEDMKCWLDRVNICYKHDDRKTLNGYELDFLFPEIGVAIELNGIWHHSELGGDKDKKYHSRKFKECENKGIQLLQIWQDEYWKSKKIVQSKILYLAGMHINKIYARKCKIGWLNDNDLEREFLNINHIQGFADYRKFSAAAWHNDKLVGVMSFAFQNKYWEIVRFATDISVNIPGLFSRLLRFVIDSGKVQDKIVSFSDNRISNGKLYSVTGFTLEETITPAYQYTNDYVTRENRQGFMKSKLITRFGLDPDYVKNSTEWQIVQELGYDRLWDAGKKKWVLSL
jgi:very-short-patch-repair endonuclease